MIMWLDNPLKYTYIRQTPWTNHFAKFNEKKFLNSYENAHSVIGYDRLPQKRKGYFEFMVYWLKNYDYDIDQNSPYNKDHIPCEGVKPGDLIDCPEQFTFREAVVE